MNCYAWTKIKSGSVSSNFDLNFSVGAMSVVGSASLAINTSYRETCRAHNGAFEGDYCIRGLACDVHHVYNGQVGPGVLDFGGSGFFGMPSVLPGGEWRVYMGMDCFGGRLQYFDTKLNAYGRKAKAYYEDPINEPELHNASPSKSFLILNVYDPLTGQGYAPSSDQAYIQYTPFSYAVGNGIDYSLTGTVSISEWISSAEEPYWARSDYPYFGTGRRIFSNIEVYGG